MIESSSPDMGPGACAAALGSVSMRTPCWGVKDGTTTAAAAVPTCVCMPVTLALRLAQHM